MIEFEIQRNKKFQIQSKHINRQESPVTYKLLVFEKRGTYEFNVIKFLEQGTEKTESLSFREKKDFSGQFYMYNEKGEMTVSSKFENGSFVSDLEPIEENDLPSISENNRYKLTEDCYVETTEHWTDWYQVGVGYIGSTYEGTTHTEVCYDTGGGGGDSSGGSGGGTYTEYTSSTAPDHFLSMSPEFKYPPDSGYEEEYPKLTEYLRNQLPHIATNDRIVDAILKYTDLTREEVVEHLQWGQGPTIEIIQLDDACSSCDSDTVGLFKISSPNTIYLDIDDILLIENSSPEQHIADAFIFWIGTTILHEYVHFGDALDGKLYPGVNDAGDAFETDAYGQDVKKSNAVDVLLKGSKDYNQ